MSMSKTAYSDIEKGSIAHVEKLHLYSPFNCIVEQIKADTGTFMITSKFGCHGDISHLTEEWVILLEPRRLSERNITEEK